MRELTVTEVMFVGGGRKGCSLGSGKNNYGGVSDTGSLGQDLIQIYEGLVAATSHIIERVASAFE